MSRHCPGGSSRVFRKALAASSFIRSASMNTAIFHFPSAARCCKKGSTARISSRRMRRDLDLGRTSRQYSSLTLSRWSARMPFISSSNCRIRREAPWCSSPTMSRAWGSRLREKAVRSRSNAWDAVNAICSYESISLRQGNRKDWYMSDISCTKGAGYGTK